MATTDAGLEIRRAEERGSTDLGWLRSRHSFSFGAYRDPSRMSFRSLRVLNDDVVEPGGGFGAHGHENMEIISWVLDGELAHEDSTGTRGVIRPGDVQVMSAGRGIRHSEMNASSSKPVHFLQIWLEPAERDIEPAYAQASFPVEERRNRWRLVAAPDDRDGALRLHQDASLWIADVQPGHELDLRVDEGRHGYVHVAFGHVRVGAAMLGGGDALALAAAGTRRMEAVEESELLLFDLA